MQQYAWPIRPAGEPMADRSKKDDAQAQFAKLQRANDAKQAMSEYEAEVEAVRARTAVLRAKRLARDAELAAAAAAAPAKKPAGKKKAAAPVTSE